MGFLGRTYIPFGDTGIENFLLVLNSPFFGVSDWGGFFAGGLRALLRGLENGKAPKKVKGERKRMSISGFFGFFWTCLKILT